ncbi:DUF3098 domain-containing protein [Flavobacterium sp. NKUCC04_CG]|uniref:DUF3098 domain-containing protein n=1 Tax=Flavobacterium sp. NKUCC04_CG TaxID=2842121 RepID=UPI001C5B2F31|nr:DUF3098 domain-containing protein [Flavobacterium sp. NKUCC04_CG]MBW3518246.1 DUF3098 domain-containing protein [Flavobacterium sp. NKUCC04_CG]
MNKNEKQPSEFLFDKTNYIFLIAGVLIIALGYLLMSGGGNDNPAEFNDAIFNFRRIRLAPTVIFIGFGVCIYSIFKKTAK